VTNGLASLTPAERASLDSEIAAQPGLFCPLLHAIAEDYHGLTRRTSEAIPRVLFVLIPALALVLRQFYRGRHYPEHLYFATPLGAFVFVVLTIETVADFTRSVPE
jgi:hypothetical protein